MTYYSVLEVTPTSEDWIPGYLSAAKTALARHGGRFLARNARHEQIEGQGRTAGLRVLIEWPSEEAAKAFIADREYVPHLKARQAGSESFHWLIEGKDDLA
ncbi:DUF1330 domain-containing protein [Paracoccus indicus]|uniref:DUF1330 domain-containing protein n=1 Tax=Paracoccus indicus TaxID=2079229 RepID=UPI00147826D0|nr:DUF1330 domain-containing protein [Paracoccus indicus]